MLDKGRLSAGRDIGPDLLGVERPDSEALRGLACGCPGRSFSFLSLGACRSAFVFCSVAWSDPGATGSFPETSSLGMRDVDILAWHLKIALAFSRRRLELKCCRQDAHQKSLTCRDSSKLHARLQSMCAERRKQMWTCLPGIREVTLSQLAAPV